MKIGIDISQIAYEGSGVASYTANLVKSLLKIDSEDTFVLFGSSLRKRKSLKDFVKSLEARNTKVKFSFFPPKLLEFLWNGVHTFPVENFIGEVDVFHSSDWLEPPTKKAKRVTTIHDLAVFKFPDSFRPRGGHDIVGNQKRRLHFVKNFSHKIIAVSETAKKDAMEILHLPEEKITVIYEAADEIYFPRGELSVNRVKEKFNIKNQYFLCVGTREPRKNIDRVVMAFADVVETNENLSLVIVGKYGWGEDKLKIKNEKLKIKLLGFVEKEDLACLYSGAVALVYPSLYEGFGLPILEAMACGCPVITSDQGSMKEIAGKAALLVLPENVFEISLALSKILRNKSLAENLRIEGRIRAKEFSWEKTALKTLAVYRSLVV